MLTEQCKGDGGKHMGLMWNHGSVTLGQIPASAFLGAVISVLPLLKKLCGTGSFPGLLEQGGLG